ncbi:huntingtin interacting protein k [Chrysochromulina tobinii]|uniref:Huntingtin interacting protein k n=1 Tax=Chrysochromulina tobinii TaxID=1460289 RepID=A0A0M0JL70_9EUKA|nr:huntingtin interacting protein k [Chrysochromulina tobinii]|eukprot:KOO27062.1 huntingtin interacting protein k [Chrysochromulina sp. CCMP291]
MAPKKKGGDSPKAEPAAGAAAGPAADAMVDGEADDDEEEVEQGNKRDGADVSKVTDFVEQKELDSAKASKALASITAADEVDRAAERERERELAAVVIDQADVVMIATEMELDKDVAERTLREHKGDVVAALNTLVAA